MTLRIAIKAPLAPKALPLPKDGQGHDLTPAEGCLWPRMRLGEQNGLAKVVCHDVKSGQEGVSIDHSGAPYPREDGAYAIGERHLLCNDQLSTHTKRSSV